MAYGYNKLNDFRVWISYEGTESHLIHSSIDSPLLAFLSQYVASSTKLMESAGASPTSEYLFSRFFLILIPLQEADRLRFGEFGIFPNEDPLPWFFP